MHQQKIALYKTRDFGAKINATIEYIRYNIGSLLKIVLLIIAPIGLLLGILYMNTFSTFSQIGLNQNPDEVAALNMMSNLGMNYLVMMAISTLTIAFMVSAVYTYMKLNDKQDVRPSVIEVYNKIFRKLPMLLVLMILITIISTAGFLLLIIPGIYLSVTLSLAIPIYLFEEDGIGKAFSKSFQLIKGKWWSTFGLLIITGLIATITSYVFAIPMYAFMFGSMFTTLSEGAANDPQAVFSIFSSWSSAAGMAFMMIGSYITYLIPIIGLSFQYFNLSERVEGRGIRNQIEGFEAVA